MFRPMRRHRQQLSQGDCAAILSRGPPASWPWPATAATPMRSPSAMCIRRERCSSTVPRQGTSWTPCVGAARRPSASSIRIRWSPGVHHLLSQRHRLRPDPYFGGRGGETKLPFGSWRRNIAPATAGASPGGHSPGGRRTVPCVALHRAHDRQAGHRAGSGRPPAG